MRKFACLTIWLLMMTLAVSCSSSGTSDVTLPTETGKNAAAESHQLWGYFQFIANPDARTLDVIPMRDTAMHLNALVFLEPPPLVNLTLESLQFNGDIIEADIGLRHPFLGLTEFSGFDVCGILISKGSTGGFSDAALLMPGENDTRLLNPDAYSRWWNPSEFPADGSMFGYKDGLLGTPNATGNYTATLNGYKYYCDDLTDPDDPLTAVTQAKRGLFSAGQKNIRHYSIKLGSAGLVFNYAVDANWKFPVGPAPWTAPDDFPPDANRPEAWRIDTSELANTLFNDGTDNGGDLKLQVDVYDWFNAGLNTIRIESPGNFPVIESATPTGGGEGFSTYEVEILDATPAPSSIPLLISVISEKADFEGFIAGTNTTVYFTGAASVSSEAPVNYHWEYDTMSTFSETLYTGWEIMDDISPALIEETDHDIGLTWALTDTNEVYNGADSAFLLARSTDNGVTYGSQQWADGGGEGLERRDTNKIFAAPNGTAFAISAFVANYYYIVRVENPWGAGNRGVFVFVPTRDDEVFVDDAGYVYCFTDTGGSISLKHSQAPDNLDPWTWQNSPPYTTFPVAPGGYCSHVRSAGIDSSNVAWLAYYNTSENQIKLAHSTGASPHESWDASTVAYNAGGGISQVKDPCLFIDSSDIFHICYTRFDSTSGEYQLVYTQDDSAFVNPPETVIVEYSTPINDAHISIGHKYGRTVMIFTYENDNSVFLITLVDGEPIGPPEEIDGSTDDYDPDSILDTDQCDMHSVWSTMVGSNRQIARRNAVLVED